MEIQEIKIQLTLATVLQHYNLKPDKNNRLNCPFHEDKTPSFQVYPKTNTAYCFSSNCPTHGKAMDTIEIVQRMENTDKHKALIKCEELIRGTTPTINPINPTTSIESIMNKEEFLQKMFTYFKSGLLNSKPAQEYIKNRNLDHTKSEIGYNSGQFHHGKRKDETLINNGLKYGLLANSNKSNTGEPGYNVFGKSCIVFSLKNKQNEIKGLYFRSTVNNEESKHFYLKDREGIYPGYPKQETKKLILTEAIIDAASFLQIPQIKANYSILACYGTNGLNEEIKAAIKELRALNEIIFAFDNDDAGNKAVEKYAKELKIGNGQLIISKIELPCKDVNETLQAHEPEIFTHLLETRTFIFSTEKSTEKEKTQSPEIVTKSIITENNKLNTSNPYKLIFTTETAIYSIKGGVDKVMNKLNITLEIMNEKLNESINKRRFKLDLYDNKQVEKIIQEASELLQINKSNLEKDIHELTEQLDNYREKEMQSGNDNNTTTATNYALTAEEKNKAIDFLKKPKVIKRLSELLGKTGIVAEERNRIFLCCIAISHLQKETLHALIQGSSGSGKTRLLKQISDCMPPEKVTKLTRISDKVLYNYPETYFVNRLLCLEDIDGLSEEAEFAFRELQSNGELNSATSQKLDNGQIVAGQKTVKGPIASLACTTHGEIFEDNMSRVFLVAVDESKEKIKKVIDYQNAKAAGVIDNREEEAIKKFIQLLVRLLQPYEIQNPYAQKVFLPEDAHKILRLNEMFQHFVKIVTLINQYQRRKNERGQLISAKEDIEIAVEIMFESIVLKVDELDGSSRQFFEKLKTYLQKTYNGSHQKAEFGQREIRQTFNISKAQTNRYLSILKSLEYIQHGGLSNKGFKYKISYWDDYKALRERIKTDINNQLKALE